MAKTVRFSQKKVTRGVVQVITIAKFRRPAHPRNCNIHRYHVWTWRTFEDDPQEQPIDGMKCQCGCLTWAHRTLPPRLGDLLKEGS